MVEDGHPTPSQLMRMRKDQRAVAPTEQQLQPPVPAPPLPHSNPTTEIALIPTLQETDGPITFDDLGGSLDLYPNGKGDMVPMVNAADLLDLGEMVNAKSSAIASFAYALFAFSLFCGLSAGAWMGSGPDSLDGRYTI